jgi:hypothetical protein
MKTAGGSLIDMIGLGQTEFAYGDLAWPEFKSTELTGTDDPTERSSGSNSTEIGRQCSQQFNRSQLDLNDRVMHLNPAKYNHRDNCLLFLTDRSMIHEFYDDAVRCVQLPTCRQVANHSSWQTFLIHKGIPMFEP